MKKLTACMALVLCLMMVLTGCNMVEKNADRDGAQVVAVVGGEEILKREFNEALANTLYNYGMTVEDLDSEEYASIADTFREQVLDMMINSEVEVITARMMGYGTLTAEEEDEIRIQIEDLHNTWTDDYTAQVMNEDASKDLNADEIAEEVKTRIAAMRETYGYTDEYIRAIFEDQFVANKLYEAVTADVTASAAEIQAAYETNVSTAKSFYEETDTNFQYDLMYGSTIYYYPEEARVIKHILVGFSEEDRTAISTARQTSDDEANALRDAAADALWGRVDEIMAEIGDGSDAALFDSVMQAKSDDPGKETNPDGYIVTASSINWLTEFRDGSMAIPAVGGLNTVVTDAGIHILRYEEQIPAGAASFESVRAIVEEETNAMVKSEHFSAMVEEWAATMDIKTYPERLR